MSRHTQRVLAIASMFCLAAGWVAAQDGKLRGRVTDQQTNERLVGANIVVEGTRLGASADERGDYVIIGLPSGSYTVVASYVGYATSKTVGFTINAGVTSTLDISLIPATLSVGTVTVTAERPLIQRNTTNTIRIVEQQEIAQLPYRSVSSLLSMTAGIVRQDGVMHIRGGRGYDEVYYVDGAPVTNMFYSGDTRLGVVLIREALSEVQVQTGGFTAEYGGATGGVIQTSLRTGGENFHASVDYGTDNLVQAGNTILGSTSRGYNNISGTVSGPIPLGLRFFLAGQYSYADNDQSIFLTPFSFDDLVMDATYSYKKADSTSYRLPGAVKFGRDFLPGNWSESLTLQGTLLADIPPFKLKFTGSHSNASSALGRGWPDALFNYFWRKSRRNENTRNFASLRLTHVLSPSAFYEIVGSVFDRFSHDIDPDFGDDWMSYVDSSTARAKGYLFSSGLPASDRFLGSTGWRARRVGPSAFSVIYGFQFRHPFSPVNTYLKRAQKGVGASFDFTAQVSSAWEVKSGGRVEQWWMRQYSVEAIGSLMEYIDLHGQRYHADSLLANPSLNKERDAYYASQGSVNHYGYTVLGNEVQSGLHAPRKPLFGSFYLQNKLEFRDLIVNVGARYEYMDQNVQSPVEYLDPAWDRNLNYLVNPDSQLTSTKPIHILLPRLSFSFPVTDKTVFYAMYGMYAQLPNLGRLYGGAYWLAQKINPVNRGGGGTASIGFLVEAERSTQVEMGLRQMFGDLVALTLSGYRKDESNRLQYGRVYKDDDTPLFTVYRNSDFTTITGMELTLEIRRTQHLQAKLHYTYADAHGTASETDQDRVFSDPSFRYPVFVSPLDFSQTHRGSLVVDYRWTQQEGGQFLGGLGLNAVLRFNSGHPYTKIEEPANLGSATAWDAGLRSTWRPLEAINSSSTPWVFSLDLAITKEFVIEPVSAEVYVYLVNALNSVPVLNLYPTTGSATDDGWLASPLSKTYREIPKYEAFYRAINLQNRRHIINRTGTDIYGSPRQAVIGIRLEY